MYLYCVLTQFCTERQSSTLQHFSYTTFPDSPSWLLAPGSCWLLIADWIYWYLYTWSHVCFVLIDVLCTCIRIHHMVDTYVVTIMSIVRPLALSFSLSLWGYKSIVYCCTCVCILYCGTCVCVLYSILCRSCMVFTVFYVVWVVCTVLICLSSRTGIAHFHRDFHWLLRSLMIHRQIP